MSIPAKLTEQELKEDLVRGIKRDRRCSTGPAPSADSFKPERQKHMTDPRSSPELIALVQAIDAAATPGPWVAENMETLEDGTPGCAWGVDSIANPERHVNVILYDFVGPKDAAFIAEARTLLPLLAERLQESDTALQLANAEATDNYNASMRNANTVIIRDREVAALTAERDALGRVVATQQLDLEAGGERIAELKAQVAALTAENARLTEENEKLADDVDLLSNSEALKGIAEGLDDIKHGRVISLASPEQRRYLAEREKEPR